MAEVMLFDAEAYSIAERHLPGTSVQQPDRAGRIDSPTIRNFWSADAGWVVKMPALQEF
ncbi:hypothetical protein [Egbenema bharatensis]|uniref:hypothetical protein n=1 Tax=Egbenema bharatensis TaxID=3463334 RepID=UPI003A89DCF0